jgi:hypothetical protein
MDPLRDAPKVLEFTDNGTSIEVEREGPHHFYYLKAKKGIIPDKFQCAFTSYEAAKLAVDHIFEDRKKKQKAA